jgi:hypothetical protein
MKITPLFFYSYLKCPTKCWLHAAGEQTPGNHYSEWLQSQDTSYRTAATSRLRADTPPEECTVDPPADTLKTTQWRLALDVTVASELRSSRGSEAQTSPPPSSRRVYVVGSCRRKRTRQDSTMASRPVNRARRSGLLTNDRRTWFTCVATASSGSSSTMMPA